jgi:hypothetical protein
MRFRRRHRIRPRRSGRTGILGRTLGPLVLALVAPAGCGGSSSKGREQPAPTPTAAVTVAAADDIPKPCSDAVKAVVGGGATTRVTAASPGQATCVYATPGQRVDVQVDTNPQVPFRFERAIVERGQNAAWTHTPSKAPVQQPGVSDGPWGGANWFPADREMLGTDGKQLVSVHFVKSKLERAGELKLAKKMMVAQLPDAQK